ncbi:MAG: hypothetical protein HY810_05730 [Candidatus Omnitrophica bacterium]|nr:hypothetical protein [Candidatus Omnitrophota bacterium]
MGYANLVELLEDIQLVYSKVEDLIKKVCSKKGEEHNECRQIVKEIKPKVEVFKKQEKDLTKYMLRTLHTDRLTAMGQMAAAISHELRNPLSGIKVAAEYLMRKLKDQPDTLDIVVNIHNEVIFANNIIANILEHARISKPSLEPASIKKVIEEAILTIGQQGSFNNIQIKENISGGLPILHLDMVQMKQVFMNLFINAAEAMIGGGTLKIEAYQEKDKIIIKITDTGSGIEKSHLVKIFEPFFSTKVKGIGLGLAISKEIVENHNGELSIDSKLGKGTVCTIVLPLPEKEEKEEKEEK